jgi:hypothetical protein
LSKKSTAIHILAEEIYPNSQKKLRENIVVLILKGNEILSAEESTIPFMEFSSDQGA